MKDTVVSGSLRATDSLLCTTAQFKILMAPTSSGGTTYGKGTAGHILYSAGDNGIYWGATTGITSVGTITSGTWQGTTIGASYLPTATTDAKGIMQVGTGLGVNSGTVSVTYGIAGGAALTSSSSAGSANSASRSDHTHPFPALTSCTGTLTVAKGGTNATSFTANSLIISNSDGKTLTTRAITDRTSVSSLTNVDTWAASTNIPTVNLIAHWDGRYQKTNNLSNLTYLNKRFNFPTITGGTGVTASDLGASADPRYRPASWKFNASITPVDGDVVTVKKPSALHDYGTWLSLDNGTTWYPIVYANTARLPDWFSNNYSITLRFDSVGTCSVFGAIDTTNKVMLATNARSTITGVWRLWTMYDSGNDLGIRVYNQTSGFNGDYPFLVSRTALSSQIGTNNSDGTVTNTVYGVIWDSPNRGTHNKTPTVNINTGMVKLHSLAVLEGGITVQKGSIWAGTYAVNTAQSAEYQVGVQSGAGQLYMYAQAGVAQNRGLYGKNAAGTLKGYLTIDKDNNVILNGDCTGNAENVNGTVTVAHGGTNNTSFTGSRLLYTSSDGKTVSSSSITTTGGYLANVSYLTVNGDHQTSYRVYISGSLCTTGTTYFNGSTYYINSSGTAKLNSITAANYVYFNGTTYYVNSSGTANLNALTVNGNAYFKSHHRINNSKTDCITYYMFNNNDNYSGYAGLVRGDPGEGNLYGANRFRFLQWSYNNSNARTSTYEYYDLPVVTKNLGASVAYAILTTKDLTFSITGGAAYAGYVNGTTGNSGPNFWANKYSNTTETQIGVDYGNTVGKLYFFANSSGKGLYSYSGYYSGKAIINIASSTTCVITGTSVYGAVWNDYAEYRHAETKEPGYCVTETSTGQMRKTTERLQPGCKIISDTFGMAIGQYKDAQSPIAISGRVLAYPYRDKNKYKLGAAVCSAPGGTVDVMSRREVMMYPERIVGTVSEVPDYEIWHAGEEGAEEIQVNGRIWIYVR